MHHWISLPTIVLGGAGCRDQVGIDNRLPHGHVDGLEMGFNHLKNL